MNEETTLDKPQEKVIPEEERRLFGILEEKIDHLLRKYHELLREKEDLAEELVVEKEKRIQLEKRMEILTQDRESIKVRIDQLLHRLGSIDL